MRPSLFTALTGFLALVSLSMHFGVGAEEVPILMPGAPRPIPPEEVDTHISDFALAMLEQSSNNYYARRLIKIQDAEVSVVEGMKYKFTMVLAPLACPKTPGLNYDSCEINADQPTEHCEVAVWSKPWVKFLQVVESECSVTDDQESNNNAPRGAAPGEIELDIDGHVAQNEIDRHQVQKKVLPEVGEDPMRTKLRQLLTDEKSREQLRELQSHANFKAFVKKYGRNYPSKAEYRRRYRNFRKNMQIIQFLRETEQASGQYGVTQFADYDEAEKKRVMGFKPQMEIPDSLEVLDESRYQNFDLPESFDWTKHGAVTPVKNQGSCGSCWAFSTTGNVEGQWKLKTGKLISLSEQELVDCDRMDNGCNGGLPSNAYKAIVKLGGLEGEKDYGYDGMDERCKFNKTEVRVTVKGGIALSKNETILQKWLVDNGPISIGINANAMMFYYGGVSHPWHFLCRKKGIDHGVLIVGFGTVKLPDVNDQPYWKIKNSWGESWGESGYYRVWRGDGTCGVNEMATSAVV